MPHMGLREYITAQYSLYRQRKGYRTIQPPVAFSDQHPNQNFIIITFSCDDVLLS